MQRATPALVKSSAPKPSLKPLVHTGSVPHAIARKSVPAEWAWSEAPATAPATSDTAIFTPMAYESGYRYPLLVWLHGDATDQQCLPMVMRHISTRNFVALAPRGIDTCGHGLGWDPSSASVDTAEDLIFDAVDSASQRFSLNHNRIFLAGSGSGGTMALRIALRYPDRFAGVATLDGPMPTGDQPLGRVNDSRDLPIMLAASKQSAAYTEPNVCSDLSLLHTAGCRVHVRQYPGDDDLTTAMLADLNRWAMKIVCG